MLVPEAVKPCGVLKQGKISRKIVDDALEIRARDQRACLSIGVPTLSHQDGYLVKIESKNIQGRPFAMAIINNTAKHVEIETMLEGTTNYFILPQLASDGLGYTVYISNDSIGNNETINSIKSINFYTIPYQEMVNTRIPNTDISLSKNTTTITSVIHPNPAYYKIILDQSNAKQTLILSQSFNKGWLAFANGKLLTNHVMVNNWANGWIVPAGQSTVVIFFWPQILEYVGLGILAITLLHLTRRKI